MEVTIENEIYLGDIFYIGFMVLLTLAISAILLIIQYKITKRCSIYKSLILPIAGLFISVIVIVFSWDYMQSYIPWSDYYIIFLPSFTTLGLVISWLLAKDNSKNEVDKMNIRDL